MKTKFLVLLQCIQILYLNCNYIVSRGYIYILIIYSVSKLRLIIIMSIIAHMTFCDV